MSVLYVGAYAWSFSDDASSSSSSRCGETSASGVSVQVNNSACRNCSASSINRGASTFGVNSYGGSMSVLYVGAYSWSFSMAASSSSSSRCEATSASGLSVQVNNSACRNCSASSINRGASTFGANSYGGSMSVLYVGAYAWSFSNGESSITSSSCEATHASGVSVQVSKSVCWNCIASSISEDGTSLSTFGVNSYGGSMSVLYVGAYSWSVTDKISSSSSSKCGETSASGVSVLVSDLAFSSCSALSISGGNSFGANSFGGSISVSYIGASSYSLATAGDSLSLSRSIVEATRVLDLSIMIKKAAIADTEALSGECFCIHRIYDVISYISIHRAVIGRQREFFCPESSSTLLECASATVFTPRRFTVAQSVRWWGLMHGHLLEMVFPLHRVATRSATVAVFSCLALQ